ncbi:7922_t:CDS:2 [Funneliformis geosporum]|nr:7922_t:CDS:2 [Funneliformis geosporum]
MVTQDLSPYDRPHDNFWIDKKESLHYNNEQSIPYKFDLLYRASRDGDTPAAFHQKCDNKGATIVIVKIKRTETIVGGYNPIGWEGSGSKLTYDSFIFSFVNRTNLQTAKPNYPTALHCTSTFGNNIRRINGSIPPICQQLDSSLKLTSLL